MRPAHRKPLHPARHRQSRRLSVLVPPPRAGRAQVSAAPLPDPRGGGPRNPAAARLLRVGARFSGAQETSSPLPSGRPRFPALLLPLRPRLPVITARLPPPGCSLPAPAPPAGLSLRAAGSASRPRPAPPAAPRAGASPRPGRAPRPSPSRGRCPGTPSRTNSRLHSLRTGQPSPRRPVRAPPPPTHPPSSLARARPPRASRPGPLPVPRPRRGAAPAPPRARRPLSPAAAAGRVPSARPPLTDLAPQTLQHSDLATVLVPSLGLRRRSRRRRLGSRRRSIRRRRRRHGAARPVPQPRRLRSRRGGAQRPSEGAARLAPPPAPPPAARPAPPGRHSPRRPAPSPAAAPRGNCAPGFPALCPINAEAPGECGSQVLAVSSLETPLRGNRPSRTPKSSGEVRSAPADFPLLTAGGVGCS